MNRRPKSNSVSTLASVTSLIPGRLAFLCASSTAVKGFKESDEGQSMRLISSDLHRTYSPLAADFGPVDLGIVHRFCTAFSTRLGRKDDRLLVYCFEEDMASQANACFLLGSLMVVAFGWTPEEAAAPFTGPSSPVMLRPFRDATFTKNPYPLLLLDCLKGLSKSVSHSWFDWKSFDEEQYRRLDDPYEGDLHRICPRFVAFKGPLAEDSRYRLVR